MKKVYFLKSRGNGRNSVAFGDEFCVSFNPNIHALIPGWGSDDGGPETALVLDGKYYILNGDYRKDYRQLIPQGKEACLAFYKAQPVAKRSSWSEDYQRAPCSPIQPVL